MQLSWNEIRDRALKFSREWADETSEDAEAKSFWDGFFNVFGVTRRRLASFEEPVRKADGKGGFIDLLWKGILLVEHKSRGKDLDRAFKQATDYFPGLKERDLPKYVLVSDFARFRLHDLDSGEQHEFALKDLHRNVALFGFIAGYQVRAFKDQDPANVKAAERMGALHDALKASGYAGHALEVLLVRLLFCLFAEDTGIFERRQFQDFIEQRTSDDGSDLGSHLAELFHALNTPRNKRQKMLDEHIAGFEYVNGNLFRETLPPAAFDRGLREALLNAAGMDWSRISPAIFGALFQSIMDAKARRNLGAHYTSEKNILKLIGPLFMDGLRAEFDRIKGSRGKLHDFHQKIAALKFLDPACGCGNFLVIAYRELRLLEHNILDILYCKELASGQVLDPRQLIQCNVDQFYGIEIEEFPAQIAQVAMWLTDHQMNLRVQEAFGNRFVRLPLVTSATIVNGNALRIDWNEVVPAVQLDYVLGNPPFIGHHLQTEAQKADMLAALGDAKAVGVLDFVTAWYAKAAAMMELNCRLRAGFVSTNSITQGEQVGILWRALARYQQLRIDFAHRTFKWSNEASGKAAVYCVIVGFSNTDAKPKIIYEYDRVDGDPHAIASAQINPYLVDAPWIALENRTTNLCGMPEMMYGSKPTDDGNFLFTDSEKVGFLAEEPRAAQFIKPFISAHEFLHGEKRWVLWLVDADPAVIKSLPKVREKVEAVDRFRKASKAPSTRAYPYPTLFRQVTQPKSDYILVPGHTSENRNYIPFGFFSKSDIVGNSSFAIPQATPYHFGVISSQMHMAWVRYTCGRLESRYRYSKDIVYNNFPWPDPPSDKQRGAIEQAAKAVLDTRAHFPDATLADLYDPLTMPPALVKAHHALDRAVDAAYGKRTFKSDAERVAFLFERYQQLTSLLPATKSKPSRMRKPAPAP